MRRLITLLLLVLCSKLSANVDHDVFLSALAEIETGNKHWKVGAHGERSAYQITRAVWRRYTSRPFADASTNTELARDIALRHLYYLSDRIRRQGYHVTPYTLAVAWNAGPAALARPAPPRSTRSYAARLRNLYTDFTKLEAQ